MIRSAEPGAVGRSPKKFVVEPGVQFCAQVVTQRKAHVPVAYDWLKMLVVLEGDGYIVFSDVRRPQRVRAGDVAVLMPGVPCAIVPDWQVKFTRLFLSMGFLVDKTRAAHYPDALDRRAAAILANVELPVAGQVVRLRTDVATVGQWLGRLDEFTRNRSIRRNWLTAEAIVTATLGEVVPLLKREKGSRWPHRLPDRSRRATLADMTVLRPLSPEIEEARRILQTNYTTGMTMAEVAAAVYLSESRFYAAFKDQMGKTPLAYVQSLRVQWMCQLLAGTDMSVGEIGRLAGWDSPDAAGRVFKAAVTMSPTRWRETFAPHIDPADCVLRPLDSLVFEQ
ncbi:MAG: AraC family transcriptional regulator [Bifidobacteriaceae bacterium]|nr:AraC family transcriptional regulator [Bifidobacteriaceae bacterium]